MTNKRSFFERLTGGGAEPEQEEVEIHQNASSKHSWADENGDAELSVDVYQTPDMIVIKSFIGGVRADDLDVSITRDMVTIRGKRQEDNRITEDDYFYQELYWGSFSRTILLPQEIDTEEAEAVEKHGLLIIKLPKLDKNKKTKLSVRSNS